MILQRFYEPNLAQASYLVGCEATGEALVIDPTRDPDPYIDAATREQVRIAHVTETHIHADFVSGTRELAARTGATAYLSAEGGPDWRYAMAHADGAVHLRDGDELRVGRIRLRVLHTPGHTPEHLTFLVTDSASTDIPMGAFTGDFVFVGDVGRPDLLEKAMGAGGTMEAGARTLFRSLRHFLTLPDHLQIWPGHGAGSACGRALGAVPQSTLGYEKLVSWAFSVDSEDAFVRAVLEGQPEAPRYFAEMKRINRDGPPVLGRFPRPDRLPADRLAELLAAGAIVIDTRPAPVYARGHIPGTLNIPLNRSFSRWAGSLLPYDRDLHLIVGEGRLHEAVRELALIGLDRVAGWAGLEVLETRPTASRELATIRKTTPTMVAELVAAGDVAVVDVREPDEWAAGHVPGAPNLPLGRLLDRLPDLPRGRPVVVHCQGGTRSVIAASLLRASGLSDVIDLEGGFAAWRAAGCPVERDEEVVARGRPVSVRPPPARSAAR